MNKPYLAFAIAAAAVLSAQTVNASVVTKSDPLSGGITYTWTVSMGGTDLASMINKVGAWSWDEDALPGTTLGWTHESNWVALTLTDPTFLTVRLEPQAGVPDPQYTDDPNLAGTNLIPGLTLWSNWDNDGLNSHTYENRGAAFWAEDLLYVDHIAAGGGHIIERTWSLPAGDYTLALGGSSPSENFEGNQGYLATFTTSQVPEPAGGLMAIFGGSAMILKRRRR